MNMNIITFFLPLSMILNTNHLAFPTGLEKAGDSKMDEREPQQGLRLSHDRTRILDMSSYM